MQHKNPQLSQQETGTEFDSYSLKNILLPTHSMLAEDGAMDRANESWLPLSTTSKARHCETLQGPLA